MTSKQLIELYTELPNSIMAEKSLLGCILIHKELAFDKIIGKLSEDDFYNDYNKNIYRNIIKSFNQSQGFEIVPLLESLRIEKVFGNDNNADELAKKYILELAETPYTISGIDENIKIVKETRKLRQLIKSCADIIDKSFNREDEYNKILEIAETELYNLRDDNYNSGLENINKTLQNVYANLQFLACAETRNDFLGLSSGYSDLDNYITGFSKSDLILLGARPAMGKTAFALNIALKVAVQKKKRVAMFSLEMSKEQLTQRMLSILSNVENQKMQKGLLSDEEWIQLSMATPELSKAEIYIDDTALITIPEMKSKLKQLRENIDLVIIDYLQLMNSVKSTGNRVQEISELTRSLKIMAKELNVPIIVLSQLSRDNAKREDKIPRLSDLRDSGSIEQDADIVLFLHREGYYNENADGTIAQCIVAKNRHGAVGVFDLHWNSRYTKFTTLARV